METHNSTVYSSPWAATAPTCYAGDAELNFRPLGLEAVPLVNGLLQSANSRTCDYTIGGIFMWVRAFRYEYCVVEDTLFIKGRCETDPAVTAFMLPVGPMPLPRAVALVERYCHSRGLPVVFSAVPEDRMEALLAACPGAIYSELTDWADYLYDIHDLATLSGKRLNKKRNHVNRFMMDNPHAVLEPLTVRNVAAARAFLRDRDIDPDAPYVPGTDSAPYEEAECMRVLRQWNAYPFEGALLRTFPGGPVVAFTAAEVIGDTLFVHIEKMNHTVPGAGETINRLFAALMLLNHPGLRYVNREEDCGDDGLRRAKTSYHPLRLLPKFNVMGV